MPKDQWAKARNQAITYSARASVADADELHFRRDLRRQEELAQRPQGFWTPKDAPIPYCSGKASAYYTNRIGMQFAKVAPGSFDMGSRLEVAKPRHRVEITQGFWIATLPVTNDQYEKFVREGLYDGKNDADEHYLKQFAVPDDPLAGPQHPVVFVSWHNAVCFCKWLSRIERLPYRLATEAEWEYACRSVTTTPYYWGTYEQYATGLAWFDRNSPDGTRPVGRKPASPWGLFDMCGNVWEWCSDWFGPYRSTSQQDPQGPSDGHERVIRGGSWYCGFEALNCSERDEESPRATSFEIGFRVALESPNHRGISRFKTGRQR